MLSEEVIINKTEPSAVFYNISLEYLDIPLQAYRAHLVTLQCLNTTTTGWGSVLLVLLALCDRSFVGYGYRMI